MRIDVENVKKAERVFFKQELLKIDPKILVSFRGTNASIAIVFFEDITEELLEKKSRIKKAVYAFLSDYRQWQFNQ